MLCPQYIYPHDIIIFYLFTFDSFITINHSWFTPRVQSVLQVPTFKSEPTANFEYINFTYAMWGIFGWLGIDLQAHMLLIMDRIPLRHAMLAIAQHPWMPSWLIEVLGWVWADRLCMLALLACGDPRGVDFCLFILVVNVDPKGSTILKVANQ